MPLPNWADPNTQSVMDPLWEQLVKRAVSHTGLAQASPTAKPVNLDTIQPTLGMMPIGPGSLAGASSDVELAPSVTKAGEFINNLRRSSLLSPYSLAKKFMGDVQAIGTAALEHPSKMGALAKSVFDPETWEAFKAGVQAPTQGMEESSGLENLFKSGKNPLTWMGRSMSGLTNATKGIIERAGLTPEEARAYTLTRTPGTGPTLFSKYVTGPAYEFFSKPGINHFIPFSRIGLNWLEQGFEHSPLALGDFAAQGKLLTGEGAKAAGKAALGTAAGVGAYGASPDDLVQKHPVIARTIAAGPLGAEIAAGTALAQRKGGASIKKALGPILQETPGLELAQELTPDKLSPTGFVRDYLGSYTNATRPLAQAIDPQKRDYSSKNLPFMEQLFGKAMANTPFLSETLPPKGGDLNGFDEPGMNFDPAKFYKKDQ